MFFAKKIKRPSNNKNSKARSRGILSCVSEAGASVDPPCGKRNKTCTPPDDDVILYGADLNIITEWRASNALCNSGYSDTQAFTRTI